MVEFDYQTLKKKYDSFQMPRALVEINGVDLSQTKEGFQLSDIRVENSCDFQANVATFSLYGKRVYDQVMGFFQTPVLDKYVKLGFGVCISLGYDESVREVFRGYISRISYIFPRQQRRNVIPGVQITCYDIKGLMMSGCYSRQIPEASSYSDALRKVLQSYGYTYLKNLKPAAITDLLISDTPDATAATPSDENGNQTTTFSAEMVNETDYEFAVKIAKRFNYEFYTIGGNVIFRPAKNDENILIEIGPGRGIVYMDASYDMTGLVKETEVRSIDPDTGKPISESLKNNNKWSMGSNDMKSLLSKTKKVYLDATVSSKEEAGYRADYLLQENAYRYGSLRLEMIGLPEMTPGKFIHVGGIGPIGTYRKFYVDSVVHNMSGTSTYITTIECKACESDLIEDSMDMNL